MCGIATKGKSTDLKLIFLKEFLIIHGVNLLFLDFHLSNWEEVRVFGGVPFYFDIILNLQTGCRNSTRNSFTQIPQVFTFSPICVYVLFSLPASPLFVETESVGDIVIVHS